MYVLRSTRFYTYRAVRSFVRVLYAVLYLSCTTLYIRFCIVLFALSHILRCTLFINIVLYAVYTYRAVRGLYISCCTRFCMHTVKVLLRRLSKLTLSRSNQSSPRSTSPICRSGTGVVHPPRLVHQHSAPDGVIQSPSFDLDPFELRRKFRSMKRPVSPPRSMRIGMPPFRDF